MSTTPPVPESSMPPRKRPLKLRGWRLAAAIGAGVVLMLLILVSVVLWYATTPQFEQRVRTVVISQLERTTGGRVELGAFHWQLAKMGFVAENLTIHGKERPGQLPFLHVDELVVHLKVIDLLGAKIGLSYLGAQRPVFHLIVYPDGSTNAPSPKVKQKSKTSPVDEVFSLAIDQTQLNDGLLLINEKKIPFSLDARHVGADVLFDRRRHDYAGTIKASDIVLQRGTANPVHSKLTLAVNAWRKHLEIRNLVFTSGDSRLQMAGTVTNYAHPQLTLTADGQIDLRVLEPLTGTRGIQKGVLRLKAHGTGDAQKFALLAQLQLKDFNYHNTNVHTDGLSAETQLLVTQDGIAATGFHARLATGGHFEGDLRIRDWMRHTPAGAAPQSPEEGKVSLQVTRLPLSGLLGAFAPARYQDLGFNTAFTGSADARWSGSARRLEATTDLQLHPVPNGIKGDIPVSGAVVGTYSLAAGTADLRNLTLKTPASQAHASGSLGINPSMHGSLLTASVMTSNLAEFDKVLAAFDVSSGRNRPAALVPVDIHGSASFHGTVTGTASAPDVRGHLEANHVELVLSHPAAQKAQLKPVSAQSAAPGTSAGNTAAPATIMIDTVKADAEYSPQRVTLQQATMTSGQAVVHLSGTLQATKGRGRTYTFDSASAIQAQATLQHATLQKLLPMAGVTLPATGTVQAQVHLGGSLADWSGHGTLQVQGGEIEGEPYHSLRSDLLFVGQSVQMQHLMFLQDGGTIHGSGSYDITSKQFEFTAQGENFNLAHIRKLQTPRYPLGGILSFQAQGSGTMQHPVLNANLHLTHLNLAQDATGFVDAKAHTEGGQLLLDATAHLNQSVLELKAQTQLQGDHQTQAKLTVSKLDLNPLAQTFHVSGIATRTPLDATATMNGPLRDMKKINGEITIQPVALTVEKVEVKTAAPIHAKLESGVLTLDPLKVEGPNVKLQAQGSVGLFDRRHPIHLRTQGAIDMKVAEAFNDDLTSSGNVSFQVDASGTTKHPNLNGEAKISNVNLSLESYINGLSRMNGTLVFNEGRVALKDVTAYSGGGLIQLTGSATYASGLYADVKATAHDVRIRYPEGITSMVDASLRLQGTTQSMLLSGNAQLTRFAVSPSIDLAGLAGNSNSVSLPPNPNSFSNRIRMDIHITSAPSMDFQNSYAKLAGTVNLRVRGTVAEPSVLGQVTVTEGQATFAGTTYQLQRGVIYFTNPIRIEPNIDLDATAQVENYSITVGLHGTPNHLTPVFRSSPPLSEQDIFSLLALGRTQEEQQIYSQQQAQAGVNSTADALLGGAINATVSSRIQKLFGGGSVKIDPTYVSTTGNATARLTVEQQISKNVTLTYATNVNSTAEQLIQGQWNITPNLSILAVRDESGVFSLIFTLRKQYK
uniref:Translocation and assembly module TamB C-terminal domain-containing protein n=1 Tax=Acidobacterium capsulatum TaxID=33075 RepID=A0A7V5CSH4_9BACT